ncbi:helix-turn-helix protein [Acidovorax sp. 100]|uniref:helix-turn-helix transcriptional regulator n=1 Tax=Acidovorax sp. 100 TaxID=2135635 RepID=UPI000EF9FC50|nr:helix-turn-helix transcriptional regulator [Acidovorax sp. 100]RMA59923.1 helix-turn-helix protein [Acidovorax sp. 100]
MNTFSNAFRTEVVRMARKELKPELQGMRKAITGHRSEIAALKREVKSLTSQLKAAQRQTKVGGVAAPSDQPKVSRRAAREEFLFAPVMLTQMRQALEATQLQMAALLAVSPLTYSRWEKGQAHPRTKQLAKIEEVVNMGPAKAAKKIRQAAKA